MYDIGYAAGMEAAKNGLSFIKRKDLDYNLGFITGWEDYFNPVENLL